MDLLSLNPTQFENLTFDMVQLLGLQNCIWRTPGSDVGRDIQGEAFPKDISGYTRREIWYVECKRYEGSIPWPVVWEKIAYAQAHNADVLLFVTSSSLTPQAVDQVNNWNDSRKSPLIRFWNGTDLITKISLFPQIAVKYGLAVDPVGMGAISILPLTSLLTKYTSSAYARIMFGGDPLPIYEVVQSISELISSKIAQIESDGVPRILKFVATRDGYDFISGDYPPPDLSIDRHALRGVLSLLWFYENNGTLKIESNETSIKVPLSRTPTDAIMNDLNQIAFWGNFTLNLNSTTLFLEVNP